MTGIHVKYLFRLFLFTLLCAALVSLGPALVYLDVAVLGNGVYEQSLTEAFQSLCLVCMVLLYLVLARRRVEFGPAYLLIAGFFGCMLVREQDFFLESVWFPLVLVLALVCLVQAWRRKEKALAGLVYFCRSRSFGLVLAGILVLLVFSRLLGMKIIWQSLLDEQYSKIAKNAVEEGVETLGYTLCLAGAALHFFLAGRKTKKHTILSLRPIKPEKQ